jgi:hypothetical protein
MLYWAKACWATAQIISALTVEKAAAVPARQLGRTT